MLTEDKLVVLNQLREGKVSVTFTKTNGDKREMICTLVPSVLPVQETITETKKSNPDVCSVWDLEAKGWRSFRWDSVIEINQIQS